MARLTRPRSTELTTIVGSFANIQPGQTLQLTGFWRDHPQFGPQFQVINYQETKPATLTGIEKYLGSGLIKGVGTVTAKSIVAHFGLETLDIIENQIERVRRQGYEMLRSPSIQRVEMSNLNAALHSATTENIKLNQNSPVVGKTLGELDLRGRTGATLIAVVRGDDTKIGPGANYKLQEDDILILFGKPENIERAIKLLQPDELTGGFNP